MEVEERGRSRKAAILWHTNNRIVRREKTILSQGRLSSTVRGWLVVVVGRCDEESS